MTPESDEAKRQRLNWSIQVKIGRPRALTKEASMNEKIKGGDARIRYQQKVMVPEVQDILHQRSNGNHDSNNIESISGDPLGKAYKLIKQNQQMVKYGQDDVVYRATVPDSPLDQLPEKKKKKSGKSKKQLVALAQSWLNMPLEERANYLLETAEKENRRTSAINIRKISLIRQS